MMNMKKTFILLFVAILPLLANAQREEVKVKVVEEVKTTPWSGFVTNRFWDNWFISINAGGQVYFGEYDSKDDFGRRITPAFDFAVGKWFMPTLGARIQAGGFTLKGLTGDPDNIYAKGPSRVDGYYKQKWQQFNVHVDGLLNLSNWIGGYRTDRFYEAVPFAGFGMIHGCSSVDNTKFMFDAGLINKMRLSDAFDFNVEIKGTLVPQEFDGDSGGSKFEGMVGVTVGFTYKFNQRNFRREKPTEVVFTGVSPEMLSAAEAKLADQIRRADRLQNELDQARRAAQQKQVVKESKAAPLAIFFQINKANITNKEMINLKGYADIIKNNPGKVYQVTGYADKATGTAAYNQKLSEKRAQNVADALVKKFGVNASQLQVVGKGGVSDLYSLYKGEIQLNRVVIVE
ncbi:MULTISPECIES: OmpA family protein [Odoribacteraceae]|uniref:OmpA family protein n=1 Tax=Odoribacteraceae TaxID=1853231 RepID=UPI001F1C084B|nr:MULTISPECIES: OmpA family protein [Odoribacteraceae]MCQ4873441.1 OmpA family protein [Butyricimonas paravirosa]